MARPADFTEDFTRFCDYLVRRYSAQIRQSGQIDGDDVRQAAMEAIVRARATWSPEKGSWRAWAMTRAHTGVVDMLRSVNGRRGQKVAVEVEYVEYAHAQIAAVNDANERLLDHLILEKVTSALPPRSLMMVRLFFIKDWSVEEIGMLHGVTASRVSQVIGAALTTMRLDVCAAGLRKLEWTPVRRKQFIALHNPVFLTTSVQMGQTVRQIADQLGMHPKTVREEMRRLGVTTVQAP
jgi:RNA polymerase sigma factor (sigma-70 family)